MHCIALIITKGKGREALRATLYILNKINKKNKKKGLEVKKKNKKESI